VSTERGERHAEHEPPLEERGLPEQAQSTDLDRFGVLTPNDRDARALDEI